MFIWRGRARGRFPSATLFIYGTYKQYKLESLLRYFGQSFIIDWWGRDGFLNLVFSEVGASQGVAGSEMEERTRSWEGAPLSFLSYLQSCIRGPFHGSLVSRTLMIDGQRLMFNRLPSITNRLNTYRLAINQLRDIFFLFSLIFYRIHEVLEWNSRKRIFYKLHLYMIIS